MSRSSRAAETNLLEQMISRGREYLVDAYDPNLQLLPEYSGSKTYWLYHDNYLAAKILDDVDPGKAQAIRDSITSYGVAGSGKIEILFDEAERPLPFRHYKLVEVTRKHGKTIRTERVTDRVFQGWRDYADLLAFAVLAEPESSEVPRYWRALGEAWDGLGLTDRVTQKGSLYAVYKLALVLLAAAKLGTPYPHAEEILKRLQQQQNAQGGWVTDYDVSGTPVGMANVETTCLVLLALERYFLTPPFQSR